MDRTRNESLVLPIAGFAVLIGAIIWMLLR